LKTPEPQFIATEEITWLKRDGSEVQIVARVGVPYAMNGGGWRCPAELEGADSRYPDIAGESSMQAINLAMRLIASRLGHLLQDGERLVYSGDRGSSWDIQSLRAVFGAFDEPDKS
jgi:hypothetical protein